MGSGFDVVGSAQSVPGVAGKVVASFTYFLDAMQHAYSLGHHFEVHTPDGKVFNPYEMARAA